MADPRDVMVHVVSAISSELVLELNVERNMSIQQLKQQLKLQLKTWVQLLRSGAQLEDSVLLGSLAQDASEPIVLELLRLPGLTFTQPEGRTENATLLKVLLVGGAGVGKTCLLTRFGGWGFADVHAPTIGIEFCAVSLMVEGSGKIVKLQLWDTAGKGDNRRVISSYFRGPHVILLVFDVTNLGSFAELTEFLQLIEKYASEHVLTVLVGNKADLEDQRHVSAEEATRFAVSHGMQYFETSAKTALNVNDPFHHGASEILRRAETASTAVGT